jgi:hypothetical protein
VFAVAALLLCVAGLGKLRAPAAAAAALGAPPWTIRVLAAGEVALGAACVAHPTRALAVALAITYALFAGAAAVLKRRRMACGCFGDDDLPVSHAHVIASELLCAVSVAAAVASPRALLASQPAWRAGVLAAGVGASVYAIVLVYTEFPRAWAAWSGE